MRSRDLALLAWRESRFARRRLFLFLSSISLGVAALVATQSFAANLADGVRDQARGLLGADLALRGTEPFGERTERLLDSLRESGDAVARTTSFASMASAATSGAARLAQVRAVEPGYPFYGEITTRPAGAWSELQDGTNALADAALLLAVGARVGDMLAVGDARFRVIGTLWRVPGDVGVATSFAPRLYIPARYLPETGLLQTGSRVEYEAYVRLENPARAGEIASSARPLRREGVTARTADQQQENLQRALGRLGNYLGLVGTFALLLGGIGVASAIGAYMAGKRETVATLRCLGATAPQILRIYVLQAGVMGVAGAVIGAALGAALQWVLPRLLSGFLPVEVEATVAPAAILTGVGVGSAVAVGFALLPLLATRSVSPLEALRARVETRTGARDPLVMVVGGTLATLVLGLIVVQAGRVGVGLAFAAGVAATLVALGGVAWLAVRATARLRGTPLPYTVRQGIANLGRPGNQTRTVVLALGFGVFLLATLYIAQDNLLRPLRRGDPAERPDLVLFDVQQDQIPALDSVLDAQGIMVAQRVPLVSMRVAAINGTPVRNRRSRFPPGKRPERWAVRREYRSTFRDTLVASEQLTEGEWRGKRTDDPVPPVSLEEGIAEDLRVGIGDRITWDVQGVQIPTRVVSLREVDWARLEPNFFAVFPTAVLEEAPQTWIYLARTSGPQARAMAQRDVTGRFSNVASVDLTQVQATLDEVLGRVSATIRFLAGFSILTGFVVLLGAVAVGRLQRIRESVLLRTLGAARRQIGAILLTEYALLGLLASVCGAGLAVVAGWALAQWLWELPFVVPVGALLGLAAAVTVLSAGTGLAASWEVFRHTPLEALREE